MWLGSVLLALAALGLASFAALFYFSYLFPADEQGRRTFGSRLRIAGSLFGFFSGIKRPGRSYRTTRGLYETWRHHLFTDDTEYLNFGYWREARTLDEAAGALARLCSERGAFENAEDLLDLGYGFGDQDLLWARLYPRLRITGLNITPSQVERARTRVREHGLADRVELREGSATELDLDDASVDRVAALECAFHFITRERFFEEAQRVLRPGGLLVLTDALPPPDPSFLERVLLRFGHGQWQMPRANLYDEQEYRAKLERAGFREVEIHSIRDEVFPKLRNYMVARGLSHEGRERIPVLLRNRLALTAHASFTCLLWPALKLDYVIVVAKKGGASPSA